MFFLVTGLAWSSIHAFFASAAIVSAGILWFVRRLYLNWYKDHEKRLDKLEKGNENRGDILYGDDKNPLQVGLTREVSEVKEEIEDLQKEVEEAGVEREEISGRLTDLETKADNLLEKLDQIEDE